MLLAKQKSFSFNRLYLLIAIVGSTVAPLITLPSFFKQISVKESIPFISELNTSPTILEPQNSTIVDSINISAFTQWIIIAITIILALRFLYRILRILRLSRGSYPHYKDGIRIAIIDDKRTPFSFFNVIYIDADSYAKGIKDPVFLHERYHIKAWHSMDRIIVELILLLQWMNPFIYLLKRDLIDNHEYAADAYAISQSNDTHTYLSLILSKTIPKIANNFLLQRFSHSSPIKRIKMITTIERTNKVWFQPLAVILLLGCLLSCSDDLDEITRIDNSIYTESEIDPTSNIVSNSGRIVWPPPEVLFPVNRPSDRLLKKWSNNQTFSIWIDNERIESAALIHKTPNDFSHFTVRELSNDSDDYGRFKYKVQLLSNEGYRVTIEKMHAKHEDFKENNPKLYNTIKRSRKSNPNKSKNKLTKMGSTPPPPPPVPEINRPSKELLERWSNNQQLRIEIDGEPIENTQLSNYNSSDFSLFKVGIHPRTPSEIKLMHENKVQLLTNSGYIIFKSKAEKMIENYNKIRSIEKEY